MKETKFRSLIKSISWRIIATIITTSVAYFLTERIDTALEIGGLDMIFKLAIYYSHERLWGIIPLGRKSHPLEDINLTKEINHEDKEIIKNKLKELGYIDE